MKDLKSIEKALESKVKEYLENCCSEDECYSEETEFDVTINGIEYTATVCVNGYFSFEPYYESDKFGISHYLGDECHLNDFDYAIKDLWDSEAEEYIVDDYKTIEKIW